MHIDEVRSVLSRWSAQALSARGIEFKEDLNPAFDAKRDDYRIIYEAAFEPLALDKALLNVGLTDSGHIAVGIETYERIAKRLAVRTIRRGFAVGREPGVADNETFGRLFEAVVQGRLYIAVSTLLGVVSFPHLYLTRADAEAISRSGYSSARWLSSMAENNEAQLSRMFGKVLRYQPW